MILKRPVERRTHSGRRSYGAARASWLPSIRRRGRPSAISGRAGSILSPIKLAQTAQALGAGEILLGSINRDGQMKGYDLSLVRSVADAVSIPVIASGGCGSREDLQAVLEEGHAHAAAAGSFFVY
ncbi:MAG: HisA/HisF-related TIM barrel protein [Dysosmobacter welbionis]